MYRPRGLELRAPRDLGGVFLAAVSVVASGCPLTGERLNETRVGTHRPEEAPSRAAVTWMNLEPRVRSEIRQAQEDRPPEWDRT